MKTQYDKNSIYLFSIDGGDLCIGVTDPKKRWNGWAMPSFLPYEAKRMAEIFTYEEEGYFVKYSYCLDMFFCIKLDDEDEFVEPVTSVFDGFYDLGAGIYCWDIEERNQETAIKWYENFCRDNGITKNISADDLYASELYDLSDEARDVLYMFICYCDLLEPN